MVHKNPPASIKTAYTEPPVGEQRKLEPGVQLGLCHYIDIGGTRIRIFREEGTKKIKRIDVGFDPHRITLYSASTPLHDGGALSTLLHEYQLDQKQRQEDARLVIEGESATLLKLSREVSRLHDRIADLETDLDELR